MKLIATVFALSVCWLGTAVADEVDPALENDAIKVVYVRFGVEDWNILHTLNGPYTVHVMCKRRGPAIIRQTILKKGQPIKTNVVTRECPRSGDILIMELEIIDVKRGYTDHLDLPEE